MQELVKKAKKFKNIRVWQFEDGVAYRFKGIRESTTPFILGEIDLPTGKFIRGGKTKYVSYDWMYFNL